jgi:ubiquinone/menaquinone biosynthesis C-methylase UbiE
MIPFRRRDDPFALVVGMTGVKLGDRIVQIGCADGGRLAAIAAKVGLSGQALAVVPDETAAARVRKGAAHAGVLVELEIAAPAHLPVESGVFDLAVIDDTAGLLATMSEDERTATVLEAHRVLRPGGRAMVIGAGRRRGLGAILAKGPGAPPFDPGPALGANGFNAARTLAEREGLVFVEAVKPRQTP